MTFRFSTSIPVRYADLDAQGHMNNAKYFTFMEQARFDYFSALGLWQPGNDFLSLGTILAETSCTFKKPVLLGQTVTVWVRVNHIGNKSFTFEYRLRVGDEEVATGRSVQVAYDYATEQSIRVPDDWREKFRAFEDNSSL
ncbi:MAG: acyl-CoA thioesterase [Anaerolineales bacterium]